MEASNLCAEHFTSGLQFGYTKTMTDLWLVDFMGAPENSSWAHGLFICLRCMRYRLEKMNAEVFEVLGMVKRS